jgi:hypothetical protein
LVHHLVKRDDRHLLAHAMASDFSVAWQCLSKRTIGFFVTDQTPRQILNTYWQFCEALSFCLFTFTYVKLKQIELCLLCTHLTSNMYSVSTDHEDYVIKLKDKKFAAFRIASTIPGC